MSLKIRKLSIGNDYKTAMHYVVGGKVHDGGIIEGILNEPEGFIVYVKLQDGNIVPWKCILQTMPIVLEFDLSYLTADFEDETID